MGKEEVRSYLAASLLPGEEVSWTRAGSGERIWLEDTGLGDSSARLAFLSRQGLRLMMAEADEEEDMLHFYNPRDGHTLHLRGGGKGSLLETAEPFFPAVSRWRELFGGGVFPPPRREALLRRKNLLLAVKGGRVTAVWEGVVDRPGVSLSGLSPARARRLWAGNFGWGDLHKMEAFLRAVEEAAGIRAPLGAEVLRAVLLELERAAGHGAWFCRAAGLMGRAGLRRDLERWTNRLVNVVGEWLGGSTPAAWLVPGGIRDGFPLRDRHRVVGKLADLSAEALELFPEAAALPFPRWVDSRLRKATESPSSAAWVGPLGRTAGHGGDVRREEPGVYGALSWEERESPSFGGFLWRLAADRASETLRALQIAKIFLADHPGGDLRAGEPVKGSGDGFGRCEGPAGEVCCRLHLRRGRLGRVRFSLPEQLNRSVSRCLVGACLDELEYLALLWEEPVAGREAC